MLKIQVAIWSASSKLRRVRSHARAKVPIPFGNSANHMQTHSHKHTYRRYVNIFFHSQLSDWCDEKKYRTTPFSLSPPPHFLPLFRPIPRVARNEKYWKWTKIIRKHDGISKYSRSSIWAYFRVCVCWLLVVQRTKNVIYKKIKSNFLFVTQQRSHRWKNGRAGKNQTRKCVVRTVSKTVVFLLAQAFEFHNNVKQSKRVHSTIFHFWTKARKKC